MRESIIFRPSPVEYRIPDPMIPQFLRRYPLSWYLVGAIFLILMIMVAGLIAISYRSTEETLRENARAVELQTESSLITVFETKNEGIRIFDEGLNKRMEEAFPLFLAEYERVGGDPALMDLEAVRYAIGGNMELYVIDDTATIIHTTFQPDLGLSFRDYAPYFADYLDRIRLADGFYPDRIVSGKTTGEMKKFAYMPTPDHRYILELGLSLETLPVASFQYLDEDLIRSVEQENPYLLQARVFDSTLRERVDDVSVDIPDAGLKDLLARVYANRSTIEVNNPQPGITTRYLFVELGDDAYGSDLSRIIELTYTDLPVRQALASSITYYFSLGLVALLVSSLLVVITVRSITRPIGKMGDDVDTIARGDLDHPVTPPLGKELILLEESISTMVARLKETIAELRKSEENYRTLVQSANSIILRFDTTGTITFVNEYARNFFGYTTEELVGQHLVGTIVPEYDSSGKNLREKIHDLIQNPEKFKLSENENIRKDESRAWIAWTNRPLSDHAGDLAEILSIGNDITRLKEAERVIQDLNSELEERVADRTRKLTEVNRNLESFTYSVSHDLRAPLRAISGYTSILLQDLPDIPDKDRKYLDLLRRNAHDMGKLIDDLLNFSRVGQRPLQREQVFTSAIIQDILRDIRHDPAYSRVEFRVGDLPSCHADPLFVKQVFTNLISNALKFTRTRDVPEIEIGSLVQDGRQMFSVRDNGVGFDMRYSQKIFGVFERLHDEKEYEGTGVGLAIVHRIIEMHGGIIRVESEPGRGTTFLFTFGD